MRGDLGVIKVRFALQIALSPISVNPSVNLRVTNIHNSSFTIHNSLRFGVRPGPLAETEDDEFGRFHRRHADFDDQLAQVAHFRRV